MTRVLRLLGVASAGLAVAIAIVAAVHWPTTPKPVRRSNAFYRAEIRPLYRGRYEPAGYYVGPLRSNLTRGSRSGGGWTVTLAANGLPVVDYGGSIGRQTNPVTTAQFGLFQYGEYLRSHNRTARAAVIRVANWFVSHQTRDGRWLEHFDFSYGGWTLQAPWPCALAQGQALSLLERAYRLTGDRDYLRAAIRALRPLEAKVERGGLMECFNGDCRLPFFEEYPTAPPSYVLNGFMFTLIGLYDLASVAPSSDARVLYLAGRRTLATALPLYDHHGKAVYELFNASVASPGYQAIHVYLLRALTSLAPKAEFSRYANLWAALFHSARAEGPSR